MLPNQEYQMRHRLSLAVLAISALAALMPFQASLAKMKPQPSPEDLAVMQADVGSVPPDGMPYPCSQSSEAAMRAELRVGGRTPQNDPQAYRSLEKLKEKNWQFINRTSTGSPGRYGLNHAPDGYFILFVSPVQGDNSNVRALAFSTMMVVDSDYSKTETVIVALYLKPKLNDNAVGPMIVYQQGGTLSNGDMRSMPVVTDSQPGAYTGPPNGLIAFARFYGEAGGEGFCYNVRMDRDANASPVTIKVDDPSPQPHHHNFIPGDPVVVCLNRGPDDPIGDTCDYGPTQPNANNPEVNLVFPFSGQITLTDDIYAIPYTDPDTQTTWQMPVNPTGKNAAALRIDLVKMEGGSCSASVQVDQHWQGFEVVGPAVGWKFVTPGSRTDASKFLPIGPISVCGDLKTDQYQNWFMTTTLTTVTNKNMVTIGIGSIDGLDMYQGYAQTKAIAFQFGCIIEGTPITLAGGGTLPVEKLKAGDILLGPSGKHVRVTGITPGHDTQFIKLVSHDGDSVVVTVDHPILTKHGMRRARDVVVGDIVYGRSGPSPVREVNPDNREKSVRVYNVHLVAADGSNIADIDDRAFYAGAILVGDDVAQKSVMRQAAIDRMQGKK
jgi:hypothetical protein